MRGSANQGPAPEAGAVRSARALLGVTADADAAELTRAYWRRARCLHPDLSSDPEATQQFQGLDAAYRLALEAAAQPPPPPTSEPAAEHGWTTSRRPASPHHTAAPGTSTSLASGVTTGGGTATRGDGVWVVAGPVHVRPSSRSQTRSAREEQP